MNKPEKSPTEALKLLQEVCGDGAMSRNQLFEWYRLKEEERMRMMIPEVGGYLKAEQIKMLSV